MDDEPFIDPARDPEPRGERVNHLAYILLALIVMLLFWWIG